jgi:hypothetical protein
VAGLTPTREMVGCLKGCRRWLEPPNFYDSQHPPTCHRHHGEMYLVPGRVQYWNKFTKQWQDEHPPDNPFL